MMSHFGLVLLKFKTGVGFFGCLVYYLNYKDKHCDWQINKHYAYRRKDRPSDKQTDIKYIIAELEYTNNLFFKTQLDFNPTELYFIELKIQPKYFIKYLFLFIYNSFDSFFIHDLFNKQKKSSINRLNFELNTFHRKYRQKYIQFQTIYVLYLNFIVYFVFPIKWTAKVNFPL